MKHLVKFFVVTFFLIVSTHAFAEQKIVVLDIKYVLNESKAGKNAQEFLTKKFNDNAKKFSELEKSLKKEESDLLSEKASLTKKEYTKKSDLLRKKVIDYQSQRRSSIDKLATQRLEARKILIKQIEPILDLYINENSISLVIDKKNMVGGLTEYDITKIIVEKLNKKFPSLNLQ
jgi:Skp family chaperone for outer membrane proteins